uniref:Apple domain-containing protein n=1 Tax=Cucumis sativus TaxID=3659 RepID=A0A0A0K3N8_CUCSA
MESRDALWWFIFYVFFLIFFQPSVAIDTISLNDSISGDKTIVSSKENFKLGFFTPVISRFVMDVSGQAKQFTWLESSKNWNLFWGQPRQQCEVYALCGAFGRCTENTSPICSCVDGFEPNSNLEWDLKEYSGGCRRKTKLKCENPVSNGGRDRFLLMSSMKLPDLSEFVPVGNGGDCESLCLNKCSCVAYSYQNGQCETWSGDLLDLRQLSQTDPSARPLYLKLAASEFSSRKRNTGMIIGVAVGAAVGLVIVLAVLAFILLRRRRIVGKGKTVEEQSEDGTIKFFPSLVAKVMTEEGDILGLLDPKLQENADVKEVTKVCRVACWCIQDEEVQRPSMSNIVQILEDVLEVNKPPMPRSLLAFSDSQEHLVFFTESSSSSSSNQNSKTNSWTPSSQTKSSTSTTPS